MANGRTLALSDRGALGESVVVSPPSISMSGLLKLPHVLLEWTWGRSRLSSLLNNLCLGFSPTLQTQIKGKGGRTAREEYYSAPSSQQLLNLGVI